MLCQHLLYSKVNQLYVYIYIPPLFRLPSHLGHHRALNRVPCAIQQVLIIIYFIHSSVQMSISISQFKSHTQFIPIHNPLRLKQNMDAHSLWQHSTLSQKFQVMQQSWKNFGKHYNIKKKTNKQQQIQVLINYISLTLIQFAKWHHRYKNQKLGTSPVVKIQCFYFRGTWV